MKYIKIALYLLFTLLLYWLLPVRVSFPALWKTFYWDSAYLGEMLSQPGGFASLCSAFIVQFLANRWTAALLYALPCWLIFLLTDWIISRWCPRLSLTISALVVIVGSWFALCDGMHTLTSDQRFQTQMCLLANQQWREMVNIPHSSNNLLELNLRNLALAELNQLPQDIKRQPQQSAEALVVTNFQSPYIAAMVSEIYWSMGEIAMSQCYAFQGNEKLGNLSPLLLKRLALTNIVYGQYAVARKYLTWLTKSLFDRQWAEQYLALLYDDVVESHPMLAVKRHCIPAQNGFPSLRSVAYDLQQIVNDNPEHKTSAQYLDALKVIYPDLQ